MKSRVHVEIAAETRTELIKKLNSCLANTLDLAFQAKTAHWNVKGRDFIGLHELFDRIHKHLRNQGDTLAERAVALGGYAEGTARQVAAGSVIAEYDLEAREGLEHVKALADRLGEHAVLLRQVRSYADQPDVDPVTENMIAEVIHEVEQDTWFLEAHLEEEAREAAAEPREKAA